MRIVSLTLRAFLASSRSQHKALLMRCHSRSSAPTSATVAPASPAPVTPLQHNVNGAGMKQVLLPAQGFLASIARGLVSKDVWMPFVPLRPSFPNLVILLAVAWKAVGCKAALDAQALPLSSKETALAAASTAVVLAYLPVALGMLYLYSLSAADSVTDLESSGLMAIAIALDELMAGLQASKEEEQKEKEAGLKHEVPPPEPPSRAQRWLTAIEDMDYWAVVFVVLVGYQLVDRRTYHMGSMRVMCGWLWGRLLGVLVKKKVALHKQWHG